MPRSVGVRDNYSNDAAFLTRLCRAVELDKDRPVEWRREVMEQLRVLTIALLSAPPHSKRGSA